MLIDPHEIDREKVAYTAMSHAAKCNRYVNEDVRIEMGVQLGDLQMGNSLYYMTEGRWHAHELLVYCLKQTGPAKLYMCMYSIKESQAGLIAKMKGEGAIQEIHALIDYRARVQHPDALQILAKNCDSLSDKSRTHAKVMVLRNDAWGVVMLGSANLTANTSGDAGVITCSAEVADYMINDIKKKIDGTK